MKTVNDLSRDIFREEVPGWEALEPQLRSWLEQGTSLKEIRHNIYIHIFECFIETGSPKGVDEEEWKEEQSREAMNRAFNVVEGLIENLPATEQNRQRLLDYIGEYASFNAYDRLLSDFLPLLSEEEIKEILARAKAWFIPEVTAEWEENVKWEMEQRRKRHLKQNKQKGGNKNESF